VSRTTRTPAAIRACRGSSAPTRNAAIVRIAHHPSDRARLRRQDRGDRDTISWRSGGRARTSFPFAFAARLKEENSGGVFPRTGDPDGYAIVTFFGAAL